MKCKLCRKKEANEKNTHYLTDGIIKSCLNLDGGGERETGFFFDFSNELALINPGFQRNTSVDKLETRLGRPPTEEEIENAKKNPYSTDFMFCTECENIFTSIEKDFIDNIVPKLRDTNLENKKELEFKEIKTIRIFFYIQIWRTYICEKEFKLKEEMAEKLRDLIIRYKDANEQELNHFPLTITYLNTTGDKKNYTSNSVGFTNDKDPYLILLNDFILQFNEGESSIKYFDFHGLNDEENFREYINIDEDAFKIKVINNNDRIALQKRIRFEEKIKKLKPAFKDSFIKLWIKVFGGTPSKKNIEDYLDIIFTKAEHEAIQFSKPRIIEITKNFVMQRSNVENNIDALFRLNQSQ